ncbi:MAG: DUF1345 domain-containing protein [Pseudomonadota bacterium]
MAVSLALGHRLAPPRFLAATALGIAGFAFAFHSTGWSRAAMIGFDVGAGVFLLSCLPLLGRAPDAMRDSAERNDANRVTLLALTGTVCSVILVAIAEELAARSASTPATVVLVIGTLLIAWLFSNMVYALHYAHLFYTRDTQGQDSAGLAFPGDGDPDYWDFIYFAFTLGMTFQTSDVEISGRAIRRVVILHCFAAFVFNIGVLAFTINILGS